MLVGSLIAITLAAGGWFAYRLLSPSQGAVPTRSVARAAMQGAAAADACGGVERDAMRSAGRAVMNGATAAHARHGFDRDAIRSAGRAAMSGATAWHACLGFDRNASAPDACTGPP